MSTEVKTRRQLATILQQQTPRDLTVIKFYFTWCPHCSDVEKPYELLAEMPQLEEVTFLSMDIEKDAPLAKDVFEVTSGPTFVLLKGDDMVEQVKGADIDALIDAIERHM